MDKTFLQKKYSLALAACILINLAVLILAGWFLTAKIIASSSQLKEEKAKLANLQQSWREVSLNKKELEKIKPTLDKITGGFVSSDQQIDFINKLEELARKTSNLYEISLSGALAPGTEAPEANKLSFQVRLGGSFVNLMHYLRYLENMEYLVEINSLAISQTGGTKQPGGSAWENLPAGSVLSTVNLKAHTTNGN